MAAEPGVAAGGESAAEVTTAAIGSEGGATPSSHRPRPHVIFIGGTSYSGSTVLDMMLSHDPAGFSCGELSSFIYPYRDKHLDPPCSCGDAHCDLWRRVDTRPDHVHQALFREFPDKRVHVDSSKSPIWIEHQNRLLLEQQIQVTNVLIWKTPAEFLRSRRKRDLEAGWAPRWLDYHRRYFTLLDRWVSIPYSALVEDPNALAVLCQRIGIDWFPGKHEYWEQTHHTLFGNASAKIHLYDPDSQHFRSEAEDLGGAGSGTASTVETAHRSIVRDEGEQEPLPPLPRRQARQMDAVLRVLAQTDYRNSAVDWAAVQGAAAELRVPRSFFALQRAKRWAVSWYTRHRRA